MTQVNKMQHFLDIPTEQDFLDDTCIKREKVASGNIHFQPSISVLQQETATKALNGVIHGSREIGSMSPRNERREFVGGLQAATSTKKMIENLLDLDLDSHQDDWFSPDFNINSDREDIRLLESQGYSYAVNSMSPKSVEKMNASLGEFRNIRNRKIDVKIALGEIGRINFPHQSHNRTFRYTHDLLFKIWNFHLEKEDSDINLGELEELIQNFHFFALSYHQDSFLEKSTEQSVRFSELLKYFLEKVKKFGVE